jgi:hypothetical protein
MRVQDKIIIVIIMTEQLQLLEIWLALTQKARMSKRNFKKKNLITFFGK